MRRPRYKGKNPRRPEDKYKELNPENYPDDIAHIEAQGRTPLGTHKPIMVEEILSALSPKPGENVLDLTLGYGGHSQRLLEKVIPNGKLLALDQDPIELEKTVMRLTTLGFDESVFSAVHSNFRHIRSVTDKKFDVVLADLGLSSMQIDRPERGFSLKFDAALDFRMDPTKGKTVLEVLNEIDLEDLKTILVDYGDEPYPHKIATKVLERVQEDKVKTTKDLKAVILETVSKIKKYPTVPDKAVPRVFQALRIYVNEELSALEELLIDLPNVLNPGARVAFLTFHSGEDRQVKKFFKNGFAGGVFSEVHGPTKACEEEVQKNRRSSSAKLRWGAFV